MTATTLSIGDLAIIQVNSEDSDDPFVAGTQNMSRDTISFMLLTDVGSGTQVFFTDQSWNGTSFGVSGTDATYTWTAATNLSAGTVITITDAEMAAVGIELADSGEAIYAYQGAINAPTNFLFAVEYGDGNHTFNANLTNTGLTVGNGAVAIAEDNSSYGERTWDQQHTQLFQQISDFSNWNTNDNSPQVNQVEGTNLFVAPDVQLWMAGISGGHGIISVSGDATQNGGLGYDAQAYFQNTFSDGNATTFTNRFWDPTHIVFDTLAGKFFVVDSSGSHDRILQGNISDLLNNTGTAPTMTILWQDSPAGVSDGDGVTSIALDKTNGDVYFTADNTLLRVDYNSANQTAVTLANLGNDSDDGNKNFANELVLDLPNGRAFIVNTETFNDFVESPPGSGNIIVATTTYQNSIIQVSNISPSDTNATGNTITELQFAGSFGESLNSATGAPDAGNFEDFYGKITDIDYNSLTGEFWFTTVQLNDGVNGETGGIFKATLSGSTLTVTRIYAETNATDQNFNHINVDEETGYYYVTSQQPDGNHAVYRGALSAGPNTAPTLFASLPNINDMTPEDLSVESAPTLTGTPLAATITETVGNPSANPTAVTVANNFQTADADSLGGAAELAGAQVRISGNFQTGSGHSDQLLYGGALASGTNQNGSISIGGDTVTFSYNAATGTLTFSGVTTFDNYEAILAGVQFRADGDNPTAYGSAGSRTISYSTFDGLLYSDEVNATVTVVGVNDAPVNVVPATQTFSEDSARVFSTANGNALSVSDVDANPATQALQVTLSVTHGTLTLGSTAGLSFSVGDGTGDATMTFTGTANAINAALGTSGLTYNPIADYNGSDTLTFTVNDKGFNGNDPGSTGTGTSEQDSDTVTLTINAVADIANDSPTANEDSPVNVLVQGNDTFENPVHSITAFDQGSHGSVALNDNGTAGNTADDYLVYTPDADYNGSDSFTYTVTSGGVTETATVNVTVNAVADIVDDSPTTDEDTAVNVLVQGNDTFENPAHSITGFTQGSHGAVSLDDNGTAGDTTDDFLVYTPDADYNGSDSFTYTVTSAGIAETATVNVTINAVDDPAVVQNDAFATDEATAIVGGDLFADNGSGADSDFDGPALAVAAVNGSAASVGSQITLGSGALLTVNADGTFDYDPNHAFDAIPTAASGASNTPGSDSFTYSVADGSTATVTITIGGLDNDDDLIGTPGNDTLDGGAGDDSVQGLAGDDVLVGGAGDDIIDGSSGIDRASYAGATAGVRVGLTLGTQDTLGAGIDTISGIENLTGSGFDDILGGTSGANSIDGGDGRDLIFGYSGNDNLYGGDGDDRFDGGAGNDLLDGGNGLDDAYYGNATAGVTVSLAIGTAQDTLGAGIDTLVSIERLNGSRFDDTLSGDVQANTIYGGGGSDDIDGGAGNDALLGNDGNDVLSGGDDDDILDGGAGDDAIDGGNGIDIAAYSSAGSGVTVSLAVAGAQDTLGAGTDSLLNVEGLAGSGFNDTLTGNDGANSLDGGDGNDLLEGGAGDDFINGGSGTDRVSYVGAAAGVRVGLLLGTQDTLGAGIDTIVRVENLTGSGFADTLGGTLGANSIDGGAGNDLIFGYSGNDSLFGGDGSDRLDGGAGNDLLDGGNSLDDAYYGNSTAAVTVSLAIGTAQNTIGAGIDTLVSIERLIGSRFDDTLTGDGQANTINGGAGNDQIDGGGGNDFAYGGTGADIFHFSTALDPAANVDQILDFAVADDTIELSQSIFGGPLGTLSASAFQTGASASDADDRIIYDSTTGNIYYDSDGNGAAAQVLFAHITAGLALTNADFLVGA